jgi:hypothetical protein
MDRYLGELERDARTPSPSCSRTAACSPPPKPAATPSAPSFPDPPAASSEPSKSRPRRLQTRAHLRHGRHLNRRRARRRQPRLTTEARIDTFPVRVPMLDIHTVGAGGGSIARVDAGGSLRVGPESAGAVPGPACYGTGERRHRNRRPRRPRPHRPDQLAGGEMRIDPPAPPRRRRTCGQSSASNAVAAPPRIIRVANSNMERAIRAVSVERGEDPREFPLSRIRRLRRTPRLRDGRRTRHPHRNRARNGGSALRSRHAARRPRPRLLHRKPGRDRPRSGATANSKSRPARTTSKRATLRALRRHPLRRTKLRTHHPLRRRFSQGAPPRLRLFRPATQKRRHANRGRPCAVARDRGKPAPTTPAP